jgi:hypothetical protein
LIAQTLDFAGANLYHVDDSFVELVLFRWAADWCWLQV